MSSQPSGSVPGLNQLAIHAFDASKSQYGIKARSAVHARVSDKSQLDAHMDARQAAAAAHLHTISGKGNKTDLRPGLTVNVEAAQRENGAWNTQSYGNYLVTEVRHQLTGNFEYSNHFQAIPAGLEVMPQAPYTSPTAEPQVATVLSNDDPEKQGRIQVQMLWQGAGGMKSPWVRVMTPDAGSSDLHSKNRGFVFIPEVGDQVMVGLRYNDPSRPYVMGSLYHGMTGEGGKDANVLRSIITKGGHVVELDDTNGKEKITLKDKKGNTLIIDTAADSIYELI